MSGTTPDSSTALVQKDLLICVFIHGFKGTDSTFGDFPVRLAHILETTISNVKSECIIFPAYETKGELNQATERFADWLTTLTVKRENAEGMGGGAGRARIVLCAHSMGGLLAADTCINMAKWRADATAPLWPNIIACIAFDTPFLGLHPWVFRNQASKVLDSAKTIASSLGFLQSTMSKPEPKKAPAVGLLPAPEASASKAPDSGKPWDRFLTPAVASFGAGLLVTAAAGTAYYKRQDIMTAQNWAQDHLKYVGNLWDEQQLQERMAKLVELSKDKSDGGQGILFRNFYTFIPPKGSAHPEPRTFVILPKRKASGSADLDPANYHLAAVNNRADDEIDAHTGMFDPKTNDGYYELGLGVVEVIRNALGVIPLSDSAASAVEDDLLHEKPATTIEIAAPSDPDLTRTEPTKKDETEITDDK
ncbi:hypothetical protein FS837_004204 [Tulasnella sp. UAMH 9824]|nr:hypothetical protein FS837_004204 [Tulasnella sp. UAMH 9824]